ncbi:nitroreductase family protein [Longispora albida]|uniref:nitroreductase family protein n=1 Tax=Longispora albida TaxID=203523 RepID=UPI000371B194|nr:nitroreductase family protein [Longispora albida]
MEYKEVIRRRRMVRRFADRPVDPQAAERILASALRAPSAGFAQGWAFLVLTEPADLERFWPFVPNQVNHIPEVRNAPLVVVPLASQDAYVQRYVEKGWPEDSADRWPAPYWYIDAGMATLLMLLSAVDEGLDALLFWLMPEGVSAAAENLTPAHLDAFKAEFGVPAEYAPLGAIAIGYRAEDLAPQEQSVAERRKDSASLFHRGHWGKVASGPSA